MMFMICSVRHMSKFKDALLQITPATALWIAYHLSLPTQFLMDGCTEKGICTWATSRYGRGVSLHPFCLSECLIGMVIDGGKEHWCMRTLNFVAICFKNICYIIHRDYEIKLSLLSVFFLIALRCQGWQGAADLQHPKSKGIKEFHRCLYGELRATSSNNSGYS